MSFDKVIAKIIRVQFFLPHSVVIHWLCILQYYAVLAINNDLPSNLISHEIFNAEYLQPDSYL